MKRLHAAVWHLRRIFHQVHLTQDHEHVLKQIVVLAVAERVGAVLVGGDLYDHMVPPPGAVILFDRIWEKLILHHGSPVIAISGNPDMRRAAGLDLDAFDKYTGQLCQVNTLSREESFLATLPLAPRLADMVQSYPGGIRLDAKPDLRRSWASF
jgi:DNA repair exonuclease SbcCD nuclease subunit